MQTVPPRGLGWGKQKAAHGAARQGKQTKAENKRGDGLNKRVRETKGGTGWGERADDETKQRDRYVPGEQWLGGRGGKQGRRESEPEIKRGTEQGRQSQTCGQQFD